MLLIGLGIAGVIVLAVAALTWLLGKVLGPDPDLRPRQPQARPEALYGCFGCALAASASDEHLARHLHREHAA